MSTKIFLQTFRTRTAQCNALSLTVTMATGVQI